MPAERHLALFVPVTDRNAIGVMLALRADNLVERLLQQLGQNTEPNPDRERQQSLPRCPNKLAERLLDALRQDALPQRRLRDRYVPLRGGSSFDLRRIARHAPNRNGRARRDRRLYEVECRRGSASSRRSGSSQPSRLVAVALVWA